MRGTLVEPEQNMVRVEGGAILRDVDHAPVRSDSPCPSASSPPPVSADSPWAGA
jgi:hypothetical protein